MRVVVTGAGNPTGAAIVRALLADNHQVRLFGVDADVAAQFEGTHWHPGDLRVAGSLEPVLAEREALIHVACLDDAGKDKHVHAVKVDRGTLYTRYAVEREQLDHFIHIRPKDGGRFAHVNAEAVKHVEGTRGVIHTAIVNESSPEETAKHVMVALTEGGRLGKQPGRDTDAVTA